LVITIVSFALSLFFGPPKERQYRVRRLNAS
jgi:hypothetical protein